MALRRPSKNEKAPPLASAATKPQEPPRILSPRALQIWDDVVQEYDAAGSLSRTDAYLLAQYSAIMADLEQFQDYIEENGYYIGRSGGSKRLRPEVKLCESLERRAIKIAGCLGLTPQSRKQLRIDMKKNAARNPYADLS